jgi:uncharacterized membrane protein YfcA
MTLATILLLAGAGMAGGLANAVAGGASLITYPAMLATGLPALIATASNSVAVAPGHAMAAFADRERLPPVDRRAIAIYAISIIGSIAGAILLLVTSERALSFIIPLLLGIATVIYAFSSQIERLVRWLAGGEPHPLLSQTLLAATAVYGGYFGGGLGVMLMAILSVVGINEVRTANALKNAIATVVAVVAIAIFVAKGVVSWPETMVMLAGAVAGGYAGGRLIRVLPPALVRTVVVTAGVVMTCYYAWRYWA